MSDFLLKVDDCMSFYISRLLTQDGGLSQYKLDLHVPTAIRTYVQHYIKPSSHESIQVSHDVQVKYGSLFLSAAWELARLGILRPGSQYVGGQDDANGLGYSITNYGVEWLKRYQNEDWLLPSYSRFSELLVPFQKKFGKSFSQRAVEAANCFQSANFLASCSMCGAAAESILLSIAAKKLGEEEALKIYMGKSGRRELKKRVSSGLKDWAIKEFESLMGLLSYWRDESAHGTYSEIDSNEAFMALNHLYRLAKFCDDNWTELTTV